MSLWSQKNFIFVSHFSEDIEAKIMDEPDATSDFKHEGSKYRLIFFLVSIILRLLYRAGTCADFFF